MVTEYTGGNGPLEYPVSDLSRGPKSSLPEGEQNQTVRGEQQGKLNHGDCRESPLQENGNGKSEL